MRSGKGYIKKAKFGIQFLKYIKLKTKKSMKKLMLIAVFAGVASFASAQKPGSGNITAEIGLTSLLGTPSNPGQISGIAQPMFKARYFMSESMAIRAGLGFGNSSAKSSQQTPAGVTPVITAETTTKTTGLGLAAGIEKHLAGTSKLSPYIGAEIGFGLGSTNVEITNSNNGGGAPTASGDAFKTSGGSTTQLAVSAMLGADYYITEKVFIGAEMGITLFRSTSIGDQDVESTSAGTTNKITVLGTSSTNLGLAPNVLGQVRVGIILF